VVEAAYYGAVDVLRDALRQGGDIEEVDPAEGWRPLHAAVLTASEDAVRYLLRMRADVNAPGPHGSTPLHFATRDNASSIMDLLLKAGADLGALDDEGKTPEVFASNFRLKAAGESTHPKVHDGSVAASGRRAGHMAGRQGGTRH